MSSEAISKRSIYPPQATATLTTYSCIQWGKKTTTAYTITLNKVSNHINSVNYTDYLIKTISDNFEKTIDLMLKNPNGSAAFFCIYNPIKISDFLKFKNDPTSLKIEEVRKSNLSLNQATQEISSDLNKSYHKNTPRLDKILAAKIKAKLYKKKIKRIEEIIKDVKKNNQISYSRQNRPTLSVDDLTKEIDNYKKKISDFQKTFENECSIYQIDAEMLTEIDQLQEDLTAITNEVTQQIMNNYWQTYIPKPQNNIKNPNVILKKLEDLEKQFTEIQKKSENLEKENGDGYAAPEKIKQIKSDIENQIRIIKIQLEKPLHMEPPSIEDPSDNSPVIKAPQPKVESKERE